MQVFYSPILNDSGDILQYIFDGDKITVTYNEQIDEFDFTGMPDGKAISYGKEPSLVSSLPIQPVIEAVRQGGVLKVKLVKFIGEDATEEEKFPDWIEV